MEDGTVSRVDCECHDFVDCTGLVPYLTVQTFYRDGPTRQEVKVEGLGWDRRGLWMRSCLIRLYIGGNPLRVLDPNHQDETRQ